MKILKNNNHCSKCGVETIDTDSLHCRKILVAEVKKLLDLRNLEAAEKLVNEMRSNGGWGGWKLEKFENWSSDLKQQRANRRAEEELQRIRETEKQLEEWLAPFIQQTELYIQEGRFREAEIYILDNQMKYPALPLLERYKANLRRLIPENYQVPFRYTLRTSWKPFENIRTQENLYQFVHITDRQNVESIKRYGGIFSKQAMYEYGIRPSKHASSELSWELDKRKNLWDYIHLSIQKSPMMYVSDIDPVTILVDSRFVFAQETQFADKNSADNAAIIGSAFDDLVRINFRVAKGRWSTEDEKKSFQAEILVKHHIPIEFITFS